MKNPKRCAACLLEYLSKKLPGQHQCNAQMLLQEDAKAPLFIKPGPYLEYLRSRPVPIELSG